MYKEHFGLKELPFSISPDPRYLYLSEQHREALAHLVYGINSDGGFVLLTGEIGTGKTTVCRCLLEQIPEYSDIAFILNPKVSTKELLASLCDELGINYPSGNESIKVFVDLINAYLLDAYARGRKTVLIIEEAQNLSTDVLEQIRLLTNLETNQQKLLQIIMVGQPELRDVLAQKEMLQLSQRITARYHIERLSKREMKAYVAHRLSVAGAPGILFPDSVMDSLYSFSRGIPRMVNIICDRALLGAYVEGRPHVDRKTLVKAAREVIGSTAQYKKKKQLLQWIAAGLFLISSLSVIAIAYVIYAPRHTGTNAQEKSLSALQHPEAIKSVALHWPDGYPIEKSRIFALQALFAQWSVPYLENEEACVQVAPHGLQCLKIRGGINDLLRLNRPAVLRLVNDAGKTFFVTVTNIMNGHATLVAGAKEMKVEIQEIEKKWSGELLILWKAPDHYQGSLHQGYRGPVTAWVHQKLAVAQGITPQPLKNPVYDENLVKQVKKFQNSKGLVPDGVVGSQTIIHLNNATGSREPLLTRKEETGA